MSTPAPSLLSEMMIDIYADTKTHDIMIFHDKPFTPKLLGLEYDPATHRLDFVFEGAGKEEYRRGLGAPVNPQLQPAFAATAQTPEGFVSFLQVAMKGKKRTITHVGLARMIAVGPAALSPENEPIKK